MFEAEPISMNKENFSVLSQNGQRVFIDPEHTNIELHVLENPDLIDLVEEAIAAIEVTDDNLAYTVDFGREIGTTSLLETDEWDDIVYAKRIMRNKYTRFVLHRKEQPTTSLAVILQKAEGGYSLWSAWCGKLTPTEIGKDGRARTVKSFWDNHALVFDPKIIQEDTMTTTRPW